MKKKYECSGYMGEHESDVFNGPEAIKNYAMDFIDTFTNEEIAQMVKENVLTIDEVETGLRRRIYG